jgi:hypothetical protein
LRVDWWSAKKIGSRKDAKTAKHAKKTTGERLAGRPEGDLTGGGAVGIMADWVWRRRGRGPS